MNRRKPLAGTKGEPELVHELLNFVAASASDSPRDHGFDPRWGELDDRHIEYVMDAGLAPLLYRAAQRTIEQAPAAWRDVLQAADLTARVLYGNVCDTASEIIDACRERDVRVTLLKGISIGDQYYPAAHLRPMGDIDLLVSEADCELVESMIVGRGFSPMPDFQAGEGAPHGAPLFHHERSVWVEVHKALFPKDDRLSQTRLFSPPHIASQTVASTFHGRQVFRLSDELQLAYVASYWIRDLCGNAFHPSFVPPLFDAVYLLKGSRKTLDWDGLLDSVDDDIASASIYIMLACLSAYGLDESATKALTRLATSQDMVATAEQRIICRMIDRNLLRGRPFLGQFGAKHPMIARSVLSSLLTPGSHVGKLLSLPWNVVFPPWVPERYGLRYQLQRLSRLVIK